MSSQNFKSKHVVVTGGGSGIGFAIASAFVEAGAKLTLIGRRKDRLEQAKSALRNQRVEIIQADITKPDELEAALKGLKQVDILVNNAGAASSAPFLSSDLELWNAMFEVNVLGAVSCTQQVLPQMLERGSGIVLNICSTAGLEGFPYVSAYSAAKHALLGLTRSLALEFKSKTVAFCAICPGFVETDLLKDSVTLAAQKTGQSQEQIRAQFLKMTSEGRFLTPEEVARLACAMCLEPFEQLNGKIAIIDGAKISYVK